MLPRRLSAGPSPVRTAPPTSPPTAGAAAPAGARSSRSVGSSPPIPPRSRHDAGPAAARTARSVAAVAALIGFIVGCGDPGSGEDPVLLPSLELVEELRIGALEEPAEEVFGAISSVAVPSSGDVWVLDRQVPVIRRFDADGRFLGESSARGEGPGEIQQPTGMVATDPDGVAVWDPGNARLSFFGGDGSYVRGVPVPSGLLGGSEPLLADTLGHFYVLATHIPEGWRPNGGSFPMTRIRLDAEGVVVDSVPVPAEDTEAGPNFVLQTQQGSVRPFPVSTLSTLDAGGEVVHGRSDAYVLMRGAPGAAVDTLVSYPWERIPVAGEELAQFERWLRYFREVNPAGFSASDRIPRQKPVFQYLSRDADGRIWVRMHVPGRLVDDPVDPADRGPDDPPPLNWREPFVFHVWNSDGSPFGSIELARPGFVMEARGDLLWVREQGEFGEPQLVRYRVRSSSPESS
jgi:hypothetical protein